MTSTILALSDDLEPESRALVLESYAMGFFRAAGELLAGPLDYDQWVGLGERLVAVHRLLDRVRTAGLLAIGDWLVYGRDAAHDGRIPPAERAKYADRYDQAADVSGYERGYLYNLALVASRWTRDRRVTDFEGTLRWPGLSVGHYQAVTKLDRKDKKAAEALLDAAQEGGWTRDQLREATAVVRAALGDVTVTLVQNDQETELVIVDDVEYLAGRLKDLFLTYCSPAAARASHDLGPWVWEKITEEFLADIHIRSEQAHERRKKALELGLGPTG